MPASIGWADPEQELQLPPAGGSITITWSDVPTPALMDVTLTGPVQFTAGYQQIGITIGETEGEVTLGLKPDVGAAGRSFVIEAHLIAGAQELWIERTGMILSQVQLPMILRQ